MPPKVKFDKEKIIEIGFEYVRQNGWEGLSARYIAEKLHSSTGPIYTHFKSMADLEDEIVKKALELYFSYLRTPITGDKWLDSGIALIRFAMEERHLFRCMNDEKHSGIQRKHARVIWRSLTDDLSGYTLFEGLDERKIFIIRAARWWLVHGLASLINNGWYSDEDRMDIPLIVENLSLALLDGLRDVDLPESLPMGGRGVKSVHPRSPDKDSGGGRGRD